MAFDPVRFQWVEIEGFRGFRDRARFDLDASVVVVTGPNGSGKTSFCDALQWLLLGDLSRFASLTTRRDTSYVANLYRSGQPAVVQAGLRIQDREIELTRTGVSSPGNLEWREGSSVYGDEAESRLRAAFGLPARVDFANYILRSAVLQQDLIRSVLEDKPAERYRNLVTLLGLDEIQRFLEAAQERASRAARQGERAREELRQAEARVQTADASLQELTSRAQRRADVQHALGLLTERLAGLRFIEPTRVVTVAAESVETALSSVQTLGTVTRQLLDRRRTLDSQRSEAVDVTDEELRAASEALAGASRQADAAREALTTRERELAEVSRRTDALGALATHALPLLSERCPVCDQPIERSDVQQRLEETIAASAQELETAQAALVSARAESAAAVQQLETAKARVENLASDRTRWVAVVADEAAWRDDALVVHQQLSSGLGLRVQQEDIADIGTLESIADELRRAWAGLSEVATELTPSGLNSEIAEARGNVERLVSAVEQIRQRAQSASAFEEEAAALVRSSTRAAAAVTSRRSSVISPIVQDIFSRLDPHPTLKTLDFQFDVYYERGSARPMVRDSSGTIEANPILVLSSSQANVAALACFLALGWASGSASAGFILLDDPLQSMDDVNALGFADVCRHLRMDRQLIVSTHDRRLASLLKRKLAPRQDGQRTRLLNFRGWETAGPVVTSEVLESEAELGSRRVLDFSAA
jgi:DNA repair exonuclease SbcCD ATPase subunit